MGKKTGKSSTSARKIQMAISSELFAPGEYSARELITLIIQSGAVEPWEIPASSLYDQLTVNPMWRHNGKMGHTSRWIRLEPKPVAKKLPSYDESERGPVARRMARIESLLELLCENLGIHAA